MSIEYTYDLNNVNFEKKLMCIEYPGLVNNVDKMINTLGGMDNIGIAYSNQNRRVELRLRPDDIYCKPTCGDRHNTISLLLKVKVKKKSRDVNLPCSSKDADRPQTITFSTSVIGVVDTIYKFNNLCDFQYLPLDFKKDESVGKLESIYDKLRPNFLPNMAWLNEQNVPLFLTPPVFSRFDSVHYYNIQKVQDSNVNSQTIGRTRKRRIGHAIFLSEKDENIPKEPKKEALRMLHVKFLKDEHYEKIKKIFQERPVWSKNAIVCVTNFSKDQLKLLLPAVAFYFITGPWRVMWVRYGYDPRKNPDSMIYQTFDYRMRTVDGIKSKVKAKRSYSNCLLPYKNTPASRPKVPIISRHSIAKVYKASLESSTKEIVDENLYIFRPGFMPPFRQMFYQYCDIYVPEIQKMLSQIQKKDLKYNPRCGWLPRDFDSRCREIINNLVIAESRKEILQQQKQKEKEQIEEYEEYNEEDTESIQANLSKEIEISDTEESDVSLDLDDSDDDISDNFMDSDFEESLKDT